ncbi:HGGxSTG domain-containing protein [Streptomyces sp. DSM 42041]|uniref:HGGxSTG domain-containing protein n=1 Tax=Streptomyces hazeniae TaxID=3075538 RepID=A0ABU2NRJ7_9ACTN|nr:HGGxSTG domain-containing protein [Streptomyces sp. DSM 42041]MDT0379369.1 HGGxSTG domain-containing protein [Streptomyces sp. DSM 42041]
MGAQSKCRAWTKDGRNCRNPAMKGASRCHLHRGAWSSYGSGKRKGKRR